MNWKFGIALCLIAFCVVGINGRSIETKEEGKPDDKKSYTYTFEAGKKAKDKDGKEGLDQVQCGPDEFCKKVAIKKVVCKGEFTFCAFIGPLESIITDDPQLKS